MCVSLFSNLKFPNFTNPYKLSTTIIPTIPTTDQTTLHSASSATLKMERNTQSRLLSEQKDTTSTLKLKTLGHIPTH